MIKVSCIHTLCARIGSVCGLILIVGLVVSGYALADEFGIISETYVYPDGLRLDTDSRLFIWSETLVGSPDTADKREGDESSKFVVQGQGWFGLGVIWDDDPPDNTADPKNMSSYKDGSLNFWVKTSTPLEVGIEGQNHAKKWEPVNVPDNEWRFVSIPLSSFSTSTYFFSEVYQLFMVRQGANTYPVPAEKEFHLDNVRWNSVDLGPLYQVEVIPSSCTVPTGLPKAFKAEGRDVSGNTVDIYPTWSASGLTGTFSKTQGTETVFTPGVSAFGTLTASYGGKSDGSAVTAQDISWNEFFNIFIDEGLYGSLGIYDSDGTSSSANSLQLNTVTNIHPPGESKSLQAYYTVTADGWVGFFFQEGELTDTTSTRDLSVFGNGYLHFWVRTPVDLEIGLRSSNISAGTEESKILLSEYQIPADNDWHEVYIALTDFELKDPRLELSAMKVYFNAAVTGENAGPYTSGNFWVGDIRYARNKTVSAGLSVQIRRRDTGQIESTGMISWSGAQYAGGWEIAEQYLRVSYDNAAAAWGAQIYTDNMDASTPPSYGRDPYASLEQQPSGLVGVTENRIACPMAWIALDAVNPNVPTPVESVSDGVISFASDDEGMWGTEEAQSEWSWLKDVNSTTWGDDLDGDGAVDPDEIVSDFSLTGDEYSTFVNQWGLGTGWLNDDGERVYILNPNSPVVIYLAADFEEAKVLQEYKTNTLTLELYHY